ncbi:MAG: zinc ribbon domain-containing protein [Lachnospiraceae bacterium]|nr:zinc ribbon domain-containing protein [Lachnospiraceae bacterium]
MAFCIFCGNEIIENARFCSRCGKVLQASNDYTEKESTIKYDGKVYKCPNCGELINAFSRKCKLCGYELRGEKGSNTLLKFEHDYKECPQNAKVEMIRNLVIPNSREDILEVAFFSASNVDVSAFSRDNISKKNRRLEQAISSAWMSKLEQAYYKAGITLIDDPSYKLIKDIYDKKREDIQTAQKINEDIQIKRDKSERIQELMPYIFLLVFFGGGILAIIICAITGVFPTQ